jgi:hypothetical protein
VCRRWSRLFDEPPLLPPELRTALVSDREARVESFCIWLRRLAGRLEGLVLQLQPPDLEESWAGEERKEAFEAVGAALGAAAAAGGGLPRLRRLSVEADDSSLVVAGWLPVLAGLRSLRLHLEGSDFEQACDITLLPAAAPLRRCTNLEALHLAASLGGELQLPHPLQLPPSLTRVYLRCDKRVAMPDQVGRGGWGACRTAPAPRPLPPALPSP